MDVLLHQLHVPGKPGLALAENDLELLLLGCLDHPGEVRPQAVGARVVLIAIDVVDVPSPLHGVVDQQGLLVLDALGFLLLFVFVLLTQSCIDRTKNMSHLLKGVTAHFHLSTESSDTARNYLKSLRRKMRCRDHLVSSFVSQAVMVCWMIVLIGDSSLDCRCSVRIRVGFCIKSPPRKIYA